MAVHDQKKKETMTRFILAAREVVDEIGLEKISVRKIAERAGFHNSTIYVYFEDLDELILLATLTHFNEYSKWLYEHSNTDLSPVEEFLQLWYAFGETIFARPRMWKNFFFGKQSQELGKVFSIYYDLFPEEKKEYSKEISDMYYASNIIDRCMITLRPMMKEHTRVTEENISLLNEITVACLRYLIDDMIDRPDILPEDQNRKLQAMLRNVIFGDGAR